MTLDESARIDRIEVVEVAIPLAEPFRISGGTCRVRRSLIVEMTAGGVTGCGESAPFEQPFYSPETIGSARALLNDLLVPRLAARELSSIEHINTVLRDGVRGNHFAIAGLETAYWDLIARRNNIPLHVLISRKMCDTGIAERFCETQSFVESGVALGIPESEDLDTLARWIGEAREAGYRRIKLKIRPGWDLGPARLARRLVGDAFPLTTDANASYSFPEHIDLFREMDSLGLLYHEQPLHHYDLLDHARLARAIRTPLCLDESVKDSRWARQAVEMDAARVWNIKIQRVGGLLEAVRVYRIACEHDIAVWGGTMPETGVGAMALLALACHAGFRYPTDLEPSARWFGPGNDLIEVAMDRRGRIAVPAGPGLGLDLDRANYARFRVD